MSMIDISKLSGLTQDSRAVKGGYLFAAFKGEKSDGCDYIGAAIDAGASVILAPKGTPIPDNLGDVIFIGTKNPRKVFSALVADFYTAQPDNIVAVTGTNGKTSIVSFAEQIWTSLGKNAKSLGTLGGSMTTADPVTLHQELKALNDAGITHLAMEASSHGLDQYRLDGAKISAAGFTNLSRDHLDYHADMEDYFTAKSRLFTEVLGVDGTAIINADDEYGARLIAMTKEAGRRVISYGKNSEDIKLLSLTPNADGQVMSMSYNGEAHTITLPLVGAFQAMNALCALGLVIAAGDDVDPSNAIAALETLNGARGRVQRVEGHPDGAAIFVDYAHTPDALENVLNALRKHTKGALHCVFGCGGDRDTGKRPQMGALASRLSDQVIITDDNPRSEAPSEIRKQIMAGAPNATEIEDRREAIAFALGNLSDGDVLLVAGKGHEQGQIFADRTEDFGDVKAIQESIKNLKKERET